MVGLVRAMLPQDFSEDVEHPVRVVTRFAVSMCATLWAYKIMAFVSAPMSMLFEDIYEMGTTKATSNFQQGIPTDHDFNFDISSGSFIKDADLGDIGMFFLLLLFMTMMCLGFIKLVIELVERWLTLCFFIYTSPLAMSFIGSKSTDKVFQNYIRMLCAEYFLIMFNYIFVYIFCAAYVQNMTMPEDGQSYVFENVTDACVFFMLLAAWCKLGQRLDEHLNTLGITAARTGASLGGELWQAAGMTAAAAMLVPKGAKTLMRGGKAAENAAHTAGQAYSRYQSKKTAEGMGIGSFNDALNKKGGLNGEDARDLAASAGYDTSNLASLKMGDGRMEGETLNGNHISSIPVENGQTPMVAGVMQNVGGQQMFTPVSDSGALYDPFYQDQLNPGGFKGYEMCDYVGSGGAASQVIQDKNGNYHLALNNDIYQTSQISGAQSITADNGGNWSRIDLHTANIQEAYDQADRYADGYMKPTIEERQS